MTVDLLNGMDETAFVEAVGWVFEHSPWVAQRAFAARPFPDLEALRQTMIRQVEQASRSEQLALLRAHPDLGTRAKLSDASASEQNGAGLSCLNQSEFDLFTSLNRAWRDKFDFPFLYAVKGSTKNDILNAMNRRLNSTVEDEFAEALQQVYRIARFRLGD